MRNTMLALALVAVAMAVPGQDTKPAKDAQKAADQKTDNKKADAKPDGKLPEVDDKTKLEFRDLQTEWFTFNSRALSLQDEIDRDKAEFDKAKAHADDAQARFTALYNATIAQAKKDGYPVDDMSLDIPTVGASAEIKWTAKPKPKPESPAPKPESRK